MDDSGLQIEIHTLLRKSGISSDEKDLIRVSLPFMLMDDLQKMRKILLEEQEKIENARQEAYRINMKYSVIVDKLADIEISKAKKAQK